MKFIKNNIIGIIVISWFVLISILAIKFGRN